jgi:hypothetical protein
MRTIIPFIVFLLRTLNLGAALPDASSLDQPLPEGIQIMWLNSSDVLTHMAGFPVVFEWARTVDELDDLIETELNGELTIRQFLEAVQRHRPEYQVESFHENSSMPIVLIFPRDPESSALSREVEIDGPTTVSSLIEQVSRNGDLIHADAFFTAMGLSMHRVGPAGVRPEELVPENAAFCEEVRPFSGLSRCTLREAIVAAMAEESDPRLIFKVRWAGERQGIAFLHANEAMLRFTRSDEMPPEFRDRRERFRERHALEIEALQSATTSAEYCRELERLRRERGIEPPAYEFHKLPR